MKLWQRSDFAPGDLLRDPQGTVWKVIGIADDPTISVVPVDKALPLGKDPVGEHHVICSRNFAERFPEKLEPRKPE